MFRMITALLYKDVTARILQVACVLAVCWVFLMYTVAALPISLDTSETNPLNAASSMTLASQATIIVAAVLTNIELGSGESTMVAIITGSRYRTACAMMAEKIIIIVIVGLLLTAVNTVGNSIIYGIGDTGHLVFRYLSLTTMNGIVTLSLSLLAGNVLLGLSVYVFVPILFKPFIVSLMPATNGLFYPEAIREATAVDHPLTGILVLILWLLVFLIMGYAAAVRRICRR